jgi:hypothetical protein
MEPPERCASHGPHRPEQHTKPNGLVGGPEAAPQGPQLAGRCHNQERNREVNHENVEFAKPTEEML